MNNFLTALRAVFAAGANMAGGVAPDALILGGISAVSYGAWLVFEPAGFIVGGVFSLLGGALIARNTKKAA